MVLSICGRLLPRREDIEDAFQATFLVLVRKAGSIRRYETLAAWLHRVACRIAGRIRVTTTLRSSREQPFASAPAAPPIDILAARDLHAILDEEIESLPAHYRRALILCCLEGKSQEEAAKLLECPRGTLSSWLTRGRERLRQRLLRRGIVVSTAGLTAALTPDALSAGGMIPLIGSLVRMAGAVVAGGALPAGLMSARTIALTEGVLRMMFMTKVKIVSAVSIVVAVAAAGVQPFIHPTWAAEDGPSPQQADHRPGITAPSPFVQLSKELNAAWSRGLEIKEQDRIAWGEKTYGLQAGIAFRRGDQESYEIGQSVTFVVHLRNVSDKKINLSHIETLFDELMPVVVDAQGKRLAVAPGPINLGVVPISQRSVEAGQQIALGYPWFRIRPLGWRGEVLGPTCCAEPGRYKVGLTSLGLPLDDGKDISLGTKQVELIVQNDAPPKQDRTDLEVPAVGKSVMSAIDVQDESRLFFCRLRAVQIPFKLGAKNRVNSREVILLVSRDQGKTWRVWDKKPSTEHSFHFQADDDGLYWFSIQLEDDEGRTVPSDPGRCKASLRICVDTTTPSARLFRTQLNQGTLHLGWEANDANLEYGSIWLEWSGHKDGPWHQIGGGSLPNSGSYKWRLPKGMPTEIYLRIFAHDKAGNEACATTAEPISIIKSDE